MLGRRSSVRRQVRAERRDLDVGVAEEYVRQTEPAADQPAVAEQALHLVRMRVRRNVEILRLPAQQEIAHATTRQIRQEPAFAKTIKNLQRLGRDLPATDGVLRTIDDHRNHTGHSILQAPGSRTTSAISSPTPCSAPARRLALLHTAQATGRYHTYIS